MLGSRLSPIARSLPTTVARRHASHGPSYNPPSGYIFGERPVKGQKRQRESWELIYYIGMGGSLIAATVIYIYKPDTSIQTWALKEARARMEARGENFEYKPSSSSAGPSSQ